MRTPRIYTPTPCGGRSQVTLETGPSRHLSRVLRLVRGDELTLFDGRGGEYLARIERLENDKVVLALERHLPIEREAGIDIRLLFAVAKGDRADWVIQKAVELGVTAIAPVLTERTVVKFSGDRGTKRHRHWSGVVVGACEQCGRNRLPNLEPADSLIAQLTKRCRHRLGLVLDPGGDQSFHQLARAVTPPASGIDVLIGPEGGFSREELQAAQETGFVVLSFGPRVLRAETAAIAAVASLQLMWGDLGACPDRPPNA